MYSKVGVRILVGTAAMHSVCLHDPTFLNHGRTKGVQVGYVPTLPSYEPKGRMLEPIQVQEEVVSCQEQHPCTHLCLP